MSRLTWNAPGQRFYESGVSKGVLYVGNAPGVSWNGLISVSESPVGGEPRSYYLDGVKYLMVSEAEEYSATLSAFTYPTQFNQCDGTAPIHSGMFATHQPKVPFGLSYRTQVGNDTESTERGYKIHLVYNALASATQRNYTSLGDDATPLEMSWEIKARPPLMTGYKRTAHLILDSRTTTAAKLLSINDILYGTEVLDPRLPLPDELVALYAAL